MSVGNKYQKRLHVACLSKIEKSYDCYYVAGLLEAKLSVTLRHGYIFRQVCHNSMRLKYVYF